MRSLLPLLTWLRDFLDRFHPSCDGRDIEGLNGFCLEISLVSIVNIIYVYMLYSFIFIHVSFVRYYVSDDITDIDYK